MKNQTSESILRGQRKRQTKVKSLRLMDFILEKYMSSLFYFIFSDRYNFDTLIIDENIIKYKKFEK